MLSGGNALPVVKFTKPRLRSTFWSPLIGSCMVGLSFFHSWYRHSSDAPIWGVLFALFAALTILTLFMEPQSRSRPSKVEIQSLHLGPMGTKTKGNPPGTKFKRGYLAASPGSINAPARTSAPVVISRTKNTNGRSIET